MKTLWIVGHPGFTESEAASEISAAVKGMAEVELHVLPDAGWDMSTEREKWSAADRIVLHFPLHWYAVPAMLKAYLDELLAYGWAFGPDSPFALQAKPLALSITTGAPMSTYAPGERNEHTLETYMLPLARTARFMKMDFRGVVGTGSVPFDVPAGRWAAHVNEVFSLFA